MKLEQLNKNLDNGDLVATVKIKNYGDIVIKLFPKVAKKAVENFVTHSKNGYYDNLIFHRVINDFMIQGGDPTGTGAGGESIYGLEFEDEFDDNYQPFRGALCMANAGPNTNGSQFFIVQKGKNDKRELDFIKANYGMEFSPEIEEVYLNDGGTPWLHNHHTVFGQMIDGFSVLDSIASVKKDRMDRPYEDVIIETIEIKEI